MALFLTEFPITSSKTVDDILGIAFKWIAGMKHSEIKDILDNARSADDEFFIQTPAETLHVINYAEESRHIVGLQYSYQDDDDRRWLTEVVATKNPERLWMSAKVSCDSLVAIRSLPTPKKPYIVKMILREGWGGMDGGVLTTDQPLFLDRNHLEIAESYICGNAQNHLPIVYISTTPYQANRYAVSPSRLARSLGGLAHILVEPNSSFSFLLSKQTDCENPYGGAVGIYWPDGAGRRKYFPSDPSQNSDELEATITRDVTHALANRRPLSECSWQFLREKASNRAIKKLKDEGSNSIDKYIEAFDGEIQAKDARLFEAEAEISRLRRELHTKNADRQSRGGVLLPGNEVDYYHNEIRTIACWALEKAMSYAADGSRRQHILSDLMEANALHSCGQDVEESIKQALSDYRKMDVNVRASLLGAGFDISDDGKHYKLVFRADPRYTFALSKTASDHRSGKNIASDICKTLFR